MSRLLLIIAAFFALTGCTHKIATEGVTLGITPGKSSSIDVLAILGTPEKKQRNPGMTIKSGPNVHVVHKPTETWLYYARDLKLFDKPANCYVKVYFNNEGIVTNYILAEEE